MKLSTTILEELDKNLDFKNNDDNKLLYLFLNLIVTDINDQNIYINKSESFDLYINIAKNSCNGLPHELIVHDIFKKYKIKKKMFPKYDYYTT